MDDVMFQDYMKNRYEDQKNWYSKKATFNQKKYKQWTVIVIVLSALTPVLAAISFGPNAAYLNPVLKVSLVTISAIVAIGTTILKTFRYQELWTTYRETSERLESEKYLYEAQLGVYSQKDVDVHSLFVVQVEAILNKEHSGWAAANQTVPPASVQGSEQKDEAKKSPDNNPAS